MGVEAVPAITGRCDVRTGNPGPVGRALDREQSLSADLVVVNRLLLATEPVLQAQTVDSPIRGTDGAERSAAESAELDWQSAEGGPCLPNRRQVRFGKLLSNVRLKAKPAPFRVSRSDVDHSSSASGVHRSALHTTGAADSNFRRFLCFTNVQTPTAPVFSVA